MTVCVHKYTVGNFRPNVIKFYEIMSSNNVKTIKKLCTFILKIYMYEFVCPPKHSATERTIHVKAQTTNQSNNQSPSGLAATN